MYAIIEVKAKQYNVKRDDIIEIDGSLVGKDGQVSFDKVLLVSKDKKVEIGQPYVKGAKVQAQILKNSLGEKVVSYKYRRRKSSHWKKGHRSKFTEIKIKAIELGI